MSDETSDCLAAVSPGHEPHERIDSGVLTALIRDH